jgi:ribosomal protein S18 acetylase RimI-like enzyme
MKIKKATRQELTAILDIMTIGSTGDHTDLIKKSVKAGICWVASIAGIPVGFIIMGNASFFDQYMIELLIVHPEYRRQGVASALLRKMEQICPTSKLFISTNDSNIAAQKTYEANGFIRSGYIENLDEGDPEIIYLKRLAVTDNGGRP